MRKKIAFIVSDLDAGGAQKVFLRIANELSNNKRLDITLISLTNNNPFKNELNEHINFKFFKSKRIRDSFFPLVNFLRKEDYHTVFSTLAHVNFLVAFASCFISGTTFIAREGNILSIKLKEIKRPWLTLLLYRLCYPRFRKIILQSKDMEEDFRSHLPKLAKRFVRVSNPAPKTDGVNECNQEKLNLIFAGKLEKQKGLDQLLTHLDKVKRDFTLNIFGKGSQLESLKKFESGKVIFHGVTKDISSELKKAHALVLPSLYEGFPNIVLEAMSVGTPVISFDCLGGLNEIIKPGFNGELIRPGDYKGFVEAIDNFKASYDAQKIQQDIDSRYSIKAIAKEYLELAENKTIVFVSNTSFNLYNFRENFILDLKEKGFKTIALIPEGEDNSKLKGLLDEVYIYPLSRKGTSLFQDIKTCFSLYKTFLEISPGYTMNYTIKPAIYGSLAAGFAGVQNIFSNITGLGYVFTGETLKIRTLRLIVRLQYMVALRFNKKVYFQNNDDYELFRDLGLVKPSHVIIINGSGVDIEKFKKDDDIKKIPNSFLMISRVLKDKGVQEYVDACKKLKKKYPDANCLLLGPIDENPASFNKNDIQDWVESGAIQWHDKVDDVRDFLNKYETFVLPSYREGTPRSVLEAMSMKMPIITTDAPGCRETVINEVNGFLVPLKSSEAIFRSMVKLIESPRLKEKMAEESYKICLEKFEVKKVNYSILQGMEIL